MDPMIPVDLLSWLIVFLGLLPAIIGLSCVLQRLLKHPKVGARGKEKQKILFYNLWLPCIIWMIPCAYCFYQTYLWMDKWNNFDSISWNVWQALLGAMAVGYLFGIFDMLYHFGYFIYARFGHHKYYVNKRSLCISLVGIIVYTLIGLLAWAWLGAMSV